MRGKGTEAARLTRREFCVEIAATAAVATPLALSAVPAKHGQEELLDSGIPLKVEDWAENWDEEDEGRDDLAFRYLDMLETEGVLNDVIFNRPDWDVDPEGRYTMEYHGIERLIKMVPDDVLLQNFGERACLCK